MSADGNEVFSEVRSRMSADGNEVFSGSEVKDECRQYAGVARK